MHIAYCTLHDVAHSVPPKTSRAQLCERVRLRYTGGVGFTIDWNKTQWLWWGSSRSKKGTWRCHKQNSSISCSEIVEIAVSQNPPKNHLAFIWHLHLWLWAKTPFTNLVAPIHLLTCCEKLHQLLSTQFRWNCAFQMSIHQMAAALEVTRNFQSRLLLTQFAPSFTDNYFRPAPLNGNHIWPGYF